MANQPNMHPANRDELVNLLESYNQYKADELAAKQVADGIKAQLDALLSDCDLAQVNGYELARVAPGTTKAWDTTGLLRLCDTLRRTENADMAEAIMAYFKKALHERTCHQVQSMTCSRAIACRRAQRQALLNVQEVVLSEIMERT